MPIVKGKGKALHLVLPGGLFTNTELITCCDIYGAAGVDAMVSGTGYGPEEIITDTVQLLRTHTASAVKITAAGVIKNNSFARQLIQAGAGRLSCTNGVQLLQEMVQQN